MSWRRRGRRGLCQVKSGYPVGVWWNSRGIRSIRGIRGIRGIRSIPRHSAIDFAVVDIPLGTAFLVFCNSLLLGVLLGVALGVLLVCCWNASGGYLSGVVVSECESGKVADVAERVQSAECRVQSSAGRCRSKGWACWACRGESYALPALTLSDSGEPWRAVASRLLYQSEAGGWGELESWRAGFGNRLGVCGSE